jgi:hypothetical protein
MNLKCRLGIHEWNGCRCSRCNKTREHGHEWDGGRCSGCGIWKGDKIWRRDKYTELRSRLIKLKSPSVMADLTRPLAWIQVELALNDFDQYWETRSVPERQEKVRGVSTFLRAIAPSIPHTDTIGVAAFGLLQQMAKLLADGFEDRGCPTGSESDDAQVRVGSAPASNSMIPDKAEKPLPARHASFEYRSASRQIVLHLGQETYTIDQGTDWSSLTLFMMLAAVDVRMNAKYGLVVPKDCIEPLSIFLSEQRAEGVL